MIERQLSVLLENKVGVMADVCKALANHGINIQAMSVSDTVDHAVLRIVVDDPRAAIHVLGERGALVVETDVLRIHLDDKPGACGSRTRRRHWRSCRQRPSRRSERLLSNDLLSSCPRSLP